jgi:DNA mismatch endonuclease (patch repair protein)
MDHVPKEVRSKIMASVKSRGNGTTELALGRILQDAGIRGYRKHWPVPGKPDFAWPGLKLAVFVDGCFWHGCTRCKYPPKTNKAFWLQKFTANIKRDRRVSQRLRRTGWSVIRIRECAIQKAPTLRRIATALEKRRTLQAH